MPYFLDQAALAALAHPCATAPTASATLGEMSATSLVHGSGGGPPGSPASVAPMTMWTGVCTTATQRAGGLTGAALHNFIMSNYTENPSAHLQVYGPGGDMMQIQSHPIQIWF